jgi:hypothetical protein
MSPEALQQTYGHRRPGPLRGAAAAVGQKHRFVSAVETVVGLTGGRNENKTPAISGRSGRIRTCDPCVPNAVLYRAEPRSDKNAAYSLRFRAPQEADVEDLNL